MEEATGETDIGHHEIVLAVVFMWKIVFCSLRMKYSRCRCLPPITHATCTYMYYASADLVVA